MLSFQALNLIEELLDAIADAGYDEPTPIQTRAIPPLLEGRDVLGIAQTGTGKTAAFALPVLQRIAATDVPDGRRPITSLVVTPTRELAAQIGESFENYGKYLDISATVIFGGVKQGSQVAVLKRGVDILVATPGRLLDLIGQGYIDISKVGFFVLDEADRMLDMGFIHDVRQLLKLLPQKRQNLLFSATMPETISQLAGSFLRDPVTISVTPEEPTVEAIDQSVMFVSKDDKKRLLPWLIDEQQISRAIVFTRTKHGANRLVKQLASHGVNAAAIHGNKSQSARTRALDGFKGGEIDILVATDLASRGLDIDAVEHVINYDLPNEQEVYVHRIGRTGRAGKDGTAISFCEGEEGAYLRDIEKLIGFSIPIVDDHPFHDPTAIPNADTKPPKGRSGGGGGGGGGSRGGGGRDNKSDRGGHRRQRRRGGSKS